MHDAAKCIQSNPAQSGLNDESKAQSACAIPSSAMPLATRHRLDDMKHNISIQHVHASFARNDHMCGLKETKA